MKRFFKLLFLSLIVLALIPSFSFGAGSCVISHGFYKVQDNAFLDGGSGSTNFTDVRQLIFTCTGDSVDGSIPDTQISAADLSFIQGWYMYRVVAYPTAGGTAPDAADVFIMDSSGTLDYLGSEDGGTTAYNGLNLIHATLKWGVTPNMYIPRAGNHVNYYWDIVDRFKLRVSNQGTASANYTVETWFRVK